MSTASQSRPRMVFHAPFPLNRKATSASGIRPVRMRDAFEALGYEVWEVTGTARQRAAASRRVRHALKAGLRFDFCYSESSTMPTSMTEAHHLPLHPLLDFQLFRALRARGCRVGLFYRDIYWAFDGYGEGLNPVKKAAALAAYRYDLKAYDRTVDVLYLPSMLMAPHVDVQRVRMAALPPGHDMPELEPQPAEGIHLFYVGGLGDHYRFPVLLQAVQQVAASGRPVSLTLCTHQSQWEQNKQDYQAFVGGPVRVVHANGPELEPLYRAANATTLFIEPNDYRAFASPVKLYEYVGQAKPVLASEGTLSGRFVDENGFGWTVPYTLEAVTAKLTELADHPEEVQRVREVMVQRRGEHSWLQRARGVAEELSGSVPA
ncbi:glycosyl transferase [Luteococcus peritonei]|uniref:Glycosyl transferase n=1 Tax=Luteococcus peritonei TaxID=88874 RepID=A0ABW4RY86_9ACTN